MGQGHNPASVTFTSRSTSATVLLHDLSMRKRSDGFWTYLSGISKGEIFAKDSNGFQLLNGAAAFGDSQRLGKREADEFVLILGDN